MKSNFFYTPEFGKNLKHLRKKYKSIDNDLKKLSKEVSVNPNLGTDLGGNLRKIRMKITSKNKGKSGGARVITEDVIVNTEHRNVLFISIYDKSEKESLSIKDIKDILKSYQNDK